MTTSKDMKKEKEINESRPASEQFERELRRRELTTEARKAVFKTIKTLIVFAAAAVLLATLLFPTMQVQRGSMTPTLRDGEQLILISVGKIGRGDIVAFHLGRQTMVKRVIAVSGEWVDIDEDGFVIIDGVRLNEPYLYVQGTSGYNIELPYQVPDNSFFVMGDNRAISIDSRSNDFGSIHKDEIIGRAIFRIWPLPRIGLVAQDSRGR